LLVSKPAGVLSHPNSRGPRRKAVFLGSYDEKNRVFRKGGQELFLVHRLDADTSGVLLAARSAKIREKLVEFFQAGEIEKKYQALLARTPGRRDGLWKDHLVRRPGPRGAQTQVLAGQAPNSQLRYQVLRSVGPRKFGLLSILLDTGKTHQIRAQAAHRGAAVLGDRTYGDFQSNREARRLLGLRRLFLHAESLAFTHPRSGKQLEIRTPLPEELQRSLKVQTAGSSSRNSPRRRKP
jgi:23S rRNA-/tRNA-specific pseudouridylate synthase